jgi:hypothetical protein
MLWSVTCRSALVLVCGLVASACGWLRSGHDAADADAELDEELAEGALLLADTRAPVLFATTDPSAPAFGFGTARARLVVRDDPSENGRIPVRVLGPLHVEGYVPDGSVELYASHNEALAGTPVVLRAGDRVSLIQPKNGAAAHRVTVKVPVADLLLGPFETTASAELFSARWPTEADVLGGGIVYRLPPGHPLPLFDAPHGALSTLIPPLREELAVSVLGIEQSWLRVRVGAGPGLEGFPQAPLVLLGHNAPETPRARKPKRAPQAAVPWRIAQNPGPLMQVLAGAQLRFRGRLIAIFRRDGWARALGPIDAEEVEVLAAVDDRVTVRGVAASASLVQVEESVFGIPPVRGPGSAIELGAAHAP